MLNKFKTFILKQRAIWPFWLSLVVVVLISTISIHPDFIVISKIAEKIASGNLHIYQDLIIGGINKGVSVMPPLICLLDGLFYFIFKELHLLKFDYNLTEHISLLHLLFLKSRYILVFVLSYPLINQVALAFTKQNKTLSRRISNLWIASPILIFLPFAQGNNDIYPVVLTLVFLYFAFKKNYILAMVFLGLAAASKNYSLLLVLPAALIMAEKDIKKTFIYSLISGLVYIIPTLIYSKSITIAAGGNIENYLMLRTVIPTFSVPYSIFAIGYCLTLLFLYFGDNLKQIVEDKNQTLIIYCFLIMSLFYVTWYWPQWFLWVLPFFVFLIYKSKRLYSLYLLISSVYLLYTYVGYPMNLDLNLWKSILPVLIPGNSYYPGALNTNPATMAFIVGSFVALFITFIYFLLKSENKNNRAEDISILASYFPILVLILVMACFSFITIYLSKV